jgi:nucleoside-diphosphate-sugar epimerase
MLHEMPMVPQVNLAYVDVRDVASAHLLAMTNRAANGHRFIVASQPSLWLREASAILDREFKSQGITIDCFNQLLLLNYRL